MSTLTNVRSEPPVASGPVALDRDSPLPLYVQIKRRVLMMILNWQQESDRFHTDHELSEQFKVSRMTARRALTLLESEGYVYRRPPRGTFVAEPRVRFHVGSFSEEATRLGRHASAVLLWTKETTDAPAAQAALGLTPDQPVHVFHRLRLMEDEPLALETTYFPADLTPGILDFTGGGSLWQELRDRYDIQLDRTTAVLEAVVLDEESCGQLGVRTATSGILLTRTTFDADGRCPVRARDGERVSTTDAWIVGRARIGFLEGRCGLEEELAPVATHQEASTEIQILGFGIVRSLLLGVRAELGGEGLGDRLGGVIRDREDLGGRAIEALRPKLEAIFHGDEAERGADAIADAAERSVDHDIGVAIAVLQEVVADHLALVAEAEHEAPHAVLGVALHDVPQDRAAADLNHRLRLKFRLFPKPGSLAATENDGFHFVQIHKSSRLESADSVRNDCAI